jgi:dihydrofolate synthase/folylpolyglutamate synthase
MHRLVSVLGMPQRRFASIHVVGTNGKSSVTRMSVALLEAHGKRVGGYVSPHLSRWTERILVGGAEIAPEPFAAAVERVAQAVDTVERRLDEGDRVTQFEVVTAAAFVALAHAGVEVAVIEAGLGGRLDATNVIPSRVTALPSVSLEHTELLGDTEEEIAGEKLDVLQRHTVLVLGPVSAQVASLAERVASERSAGLVRVGDEGVRHIAAIYGTKRDRPPGGVDLGANFAVARAAVEAISGPLDEGLLAGVADGLHLPGVLEMRDAQPPLLLDAAHNPGGARALAGALPAIALGRPVVACVAMLEGKDAEAFARELAHVLSAVVCTEVPAERLAGVGRPGSRSIAAGELARTFTAAGSARVSGNRDPLEALAAARNQARELQGMALVTGTHYLLPYA